MLRPTTIIMPIAVMAFAAVSFLVFIYFSVSTNLQSGGPKTVNRACTEEAKLCPDGSAVGRTGPNCEFAACPEIQNANDANSNRPATNANTAPGNVNDSEIACATDVRSCSDGSYVQRVPPSCEFSDCPPGTEPVSPVLSQ